MTSRETCLRPSVEQLLERTATPDLPSAHVQFLVNHPWAQQPDLLAQAVTNLAGQRHLTSPQIGRLLSRLRDAFSSGDDRLQPAALALLRHPRTTDAQAVRLLGDWANPDWVRNPTTSDAPAAFAGGVAIHKAARHPLVGTLALTSLARPGRWGESKIATAARLVSLTAKLRELLTAAGYAPHEVAPTLLALSPTWSRSADELLEAAFAVHATTPIAVSPE